MSPLHRHFNSLRFAEKGRGSAGGGEGRDRRASKRRAAWRAGNARDGRGIMKRRASRGRNAGLASPLFRPLWEARSVRLLMRVGLGISRDSRARPPAVDYSRGIPAWPAPAGERMLPMFSFEREAALRPGGFRVPKL